MATALKISLICMQGLNASSSVILVKIGLSCVFDSFVMLYISSNKNDLYSGRHHACHYLKACKAKLHLYVFGSRFLVPVAALGLQNSAKQLLHLIQNACGCFEQ